MCTVYKTSSEQRRAALNATHEPKGALPRRENVSRMERRRERMNYEGKETKDAMEKFKRSDPPATLTTPIGPARPLSQPGNILLSQTASRERSNTQ